jgi:hypothetical protein
MLTAFGIKPVCKCGAGPASPGKADGVGVHEGEWWGFYCFCWVCYRHNTRFRASVDDAVEEFNAGRHLKEPATC